LKPLKNNPQVLDAALQRCRELLVCDPDFPPLLSIKVQLEYLISVANGKNIERERLKEIIVGQYAAREFEDREMAFANMLYEVVEVVKSLESGHS